MKLTKFMLPLILTSVINPAVASVNSFSDLQTKDIQNIVHSYLVDHPEILLEASQALQLKQQKIVQAQTQEAILKNVSPVFNSKYTIVGNPKGKVTLVEFFDYECVHCKKMAPTLKDLVANNKDLRVIYKEFPIFGKNSEYAAAAAIAAGIQGKYELMHDKLLMQDKKLNEQVVDSIAKEINLDMNKYKSDLNSSLVKNEILNTRQLAEKLHLMGTPAIIISASPSNSHLKKNNNLTFIPGAATEASLVDLINKASNV